jgi:hypothetical protein
MINALQHVGQGVWDVDTTYGFYGQGRTRGETVKRGFPSSSSRGIF